MRTVNIDREWTFEHGQFRGRPTPGEKKPAKTVSLPHDYMIESNVRADAPAGPAGGYFTEGVAHYTKLLSIPAEWEGELVSLCFDGVMMNATVEINGSRAALQHYGYAPFAVDITPYVYFGKENRVTVTVNPSMQPNSRWYTGAGVFRSVLLKHTPKLCIAHDGIYGTTASVEYDASGCPETAYVRAQVTVENHTGENRLARVEVCLTEEGSGQPVVVRSQMVQVNPNTEETAFLSLTVEAPKLWDAENPNLYRMQAKVTDMGRFVTHHVEETGTTDEASCLFGIRTVTADAKHGLRVNGRTVKLKGGCLHHDNGLLGAVSLYDSEERKVRILKEIGFNAIRTTHNPPSAALMEACDRLGMYVFDEAFDAWGIMKQPGDFSMFFDTDWEKDLTAFLKRDRSHPAVVIWSTGNEIMERGGLNNGYTLATKLAKKIRELDPSRPVSNAVCSYWGGLDEELMAEQSEKLRRLRQNETGSLQNLDFGAEDTSWEKMSEPFVNGLDIVGYNYMEDRYPQDHLMFPDRVILGSENFPNQIGTRWPMVEATPYVIGDFTWTAWDYIGEAGIGKSVFVAPDDPRCHLGPMAMMSHSSEFPWRLANDADVDITGHVLPQGCYRSVVWGSENTYLFAYEPENYGKVELLSMWGFTAPRRSWTFAGDEGRKLRLVVFSRAEETEVLVNGVSLGRKKQGEAAAANDLPLSFTFDTEYVPGEVIAVSYAGGKEVSRDVLKTVGAPAAIRLSSEKTALQADGHSLAYVNAEIVDAAGNPVPGAEVKLTAAAEGAGELLGFGSASPVTAENYTEGSFTAYDGRAQAILRGGYESGRLKLTVRAEDLGEAVLELPVL